MRKHLKTVLLVLVTVCILWRLWRRMNWAEVRQSFSHADSLLLAGALLVSSWTNLLRALRWRTLLTPLVPVTVSETFSATNIGIGASFLFGAAIGEVVRPLALSMLSRRVRSAAAFLTVVVERACDLGILLVLFGLTFFWLPELIGHRGENAAIRELGIVLMIIPVLGLGTLILFRHRLVSVQSWAAEKLQRQPLPLGRVRRGVLLFLQKLAGAFNVLSGKRELLVVVLWSASIWLSGVLACWLVLRAFGLSFGFKQTLLVMCCGLGGALVPTPGGAAGAFHAAISGGLIFLGATLEQAAAVSITSHLLGFVPSLVFGSYYFLRSGLKLTTLRREVSLAARATDQPRL